MKKIFTFFLICISYNSFSQIAFAKRYFENAHVMSACETEDDGMIVSYSLYFDTCSCSKYYVTQFNSNGDSVWTKPTSYPIYLYKSADGGFFAPEIAHLTKYDSLLNTVWEFDIVMFCDNIYDVSLAPDSGIFVLGLKDTVNFGNPNINHLYKLDKNGNQLWEKYYYGDYRVLNVAATPDGGAIIYCNATGKLILMKVDEQGDSLWSRFYNGLVMQTAHKPIVALDNGEIGFLARDSTYASGVVIKADDAGNIISRDSVLGNAVLFYNLNTGFDNSLLAIGKAFINNDNNIQLAVREYNPDRFLQQGVGGLFNETGNYIYQASDSGYFIVAQQDSAGKHTLLLLRNSPGFEFHYSVQEIDEEATMTIFPNPATNQFAVSLPDRQAGSSQFPEGQLEIFNSLGEKIYAAVHSGPLTVDCRQFPKGIYFVRLSNSEKYLFQKLIIH